MDQKNKTRHFLELIFFKSSAEIRREASRAYLGMLWWVIEPVLYMGAFYLIFALGFRGKDVDFIPFLLCGLIPWKWFATTIQGSSKAIINNRNLVQEIYFPKVVLVATIFVTNTKKFLIILSLLIAFLVIYGETVTLHWSALLPLLLTQLLLMAAIGITAAAVIPFIPDLILIIENGLLVLFFLSGIFFDISERPENVQFILNMNPLVHIINAYRDIFLLESWPKWDMLFLISIVSSIIIAFGITVLVKFDRVYPKVV